MTSADEQAERIPVDDGRHGRKDWTVNAMKQFAARATTTRDQDRAGGQADQAK